jgi:hypothetical protein
MKIGTMNYLELALKKAEADLAEIKLRMDTYLQPVSSSNPETLKTMLKMHEEGYDFIADQEAFTQQSIIVNELAQEIYLIKLRNGLR